MSLKTRILGSVFAALAWLALLAGVGAAHPVWFGLNHVAPSSGGGGATVPVTSGLVAQWIGDNYTAGSWPDSSGNGNTATQATSSKRPALVASVLNGHAGVRFDGVDDLLSHPVAGTALKTVFAVVVPRGTLGQYATIYDDGHTRLYGALFASSNWGTYASGDFGSGHTLSTGTAALLELSWSGTTLSLWHNGTGPVTTSADCTASTDTTIGAEISSPGRLWVGDILELLVFNRALNSTERPAVESYLQTKYGL